MNTTLLDDETLPEGGDSAADNPPVRKRPKPGERRIQILQTLAGMLEQPGAERITTAALAASTVGNQPAPTAASRAAPKAAPSVVSSACT